MENNKKDPSAIVEGMLDDIMKKLGLSEEAPQPELGPDETAIRKAGLIRPDELELEQIVQETLAEDWGEPETEPVLEEAPQEATQFFETPVETPTVQQPPVPQGPAFDVPVFDELIIEDAEPEEELQQEVQEEMPVKEKEKTNKKKDLYGLWGIPHLISTAIWLFLIVAIGITLGRTVWLCATDLLALGKESMSVSITIDEDDDIEDVAQKLKDVGLIEYPKLFKMFSGLTGKGENLLRGTITFNPPESDEMVVYDYNALINTMSYRSTSKLELTVLIPEGYNCSQIFELLEKKGVCSAAALEKYAAEGDLGTYWFLDGLERGHKYCLEGYLFPDTYNFYKNDEPERVIKKLLNGFDARFSDRMIDKMVAFNANHGTSYTIREFVIMASIVEKETSSELEGYTIASVFYNRLRNSASYPFLQSDATVKYDVDYRSKGQLITNPQINASPYNTYTHKGLPVGPICNPGLASLDAAVDPEDTGYYFFIYDESAGMHRFSKTLSEHSAWARKLGLT